MGARVFLMYHELERAGRPLASTEPGYVRYVVEEAAFAAQLACLKALGLRGTSVTEALDAPASAGGLLAVTFDDGCATDLALAAPRLAEAGFGATFFVVAGFLGRRGYLTTDGLRELAGGGFEIGCHSMTHAYLPGLDAAGLAREVGDAKARLEDLLGQRVDHFACPGGRWSRRVAEAARRAGYRSVSTSRIGANRPGADPFRLARIAVLRTTSPADVACAVRNDGLAWSRARQVLMATAKRTLGDGLYERIRATALRRRVQTPPPARTSR